MTKVDKRDRATLFRRRLSSALEDRGLSQAGLARATGVDRSTISQLLARDRARLPNAHVAAECAAALSVSADWLLGLSDKPETAADLLAASASLAPAQRALVDEQIFAWHRAAEGFKIRLAPAHLPDVLKTREVLDWEYAPHLGVSADRAISVSTERLDWMRKSTSDFEIVLPLYEVANLVAGTGYYESLAPELRDAQISHLLALHEQLYPTFRIFLYDARRLFSSPMTIFGPRMVVLYLGQHYLSLSDAERVRALTRHFDGLVREATVGPRDFPSHIASLSRAVQSLEADGGRNA